MKLQEGETILHEARPERAVLWLWLFTKCLLSGAIGSFFAAGGAMSVLIITVDVGGWKQVPFFLIIPAAAAFGAAVFLSAGLIYCAYLRRTYVYYITSQRCVFHGGILRRVERSVPYHKITDVEMSQNIFERVLGISTLRIFTPGTASVSPQAPWQQAEITFVGLKDSDTPADIVNDQLRKFKATGE
ncbi:MAG: hypothetical protein AMJ81_01695 [Phycisphaerae bacterium SM23_33]|jgi:uncharacterized membrane protein YdbT with pleckstrin-like domain|nr:MAG: hypothetical protein AMJ81_01695 [Phycisphaerae bacterium SM23_33]